MSVSGIMQTTLTGHVMPTLSMALLDLAQRGRLGKARLGAAWYGVAGHVKARHGLGDGAVQSVKPRLRHLAFSEQIPTTHSAEAA